MPATLLPQKQWPRGPLNYLHRAARDGSIKQTTALLSMNSVDIDQGTPEGYTPLMIAAVKGCSSIVVILLAKGANPLVVNDDGFTALHLAAEAGKLATLAVLLYTHADLHAKKSFCGLTPLHLAAQDGRFEIVRVLVKAGADVRAQGPSGHTALHMATHARHVETVKALVGARADLEATACSGFTPLHVAASDGNLEIAAVLMSAHANLLATTSDGATPLYMAAHFGHLSVMSALVEAHVKAGAEVHTRLKTGSTPLHAAAQNGHLNVVKALIKVGADVQARLKSGSTPLLMAAQNGHSQVVRALVKVGANIRTSTHTGYSPLHVAAQEGRLEAMAVLVQAGAYLQGVCSVEGMTPLFLAAQYGHDLAVTALLEAGADPGIANFKGLTPLHQAASHGRSKAVRALIGGQALYAKCRDGFDAHVNRRSIFFETPLLCAIGHGRCSTKVVRLLVDAGANMTSTVQVPWILGGGAVFTETPLEATSRNLREMKDDAHDSQVEQVHALEGTRRLLLHVEAIHAVSWLWCDPVGPIAAGRATDSSARDKTISTPLRMMLPALRRRRRGVLLGALFRWVVNFCYVVSALAGARGFNIW